MTAGVIASPRVAAKPSFASVGKQLYWRWRRPQRPLLHVFRALVGFSQNAFVVAAERARGDVRFVALIEHMGDIVAAQPIARAARESTRGRVVWVVRRPYRELVASYPEVDRVVEVRCLTEWLMLWSLLPPRVVWDLHISGRTCPICEAGFCKPGPAAAIDAASYYEAGNLLEVERRAAGIPPLSDDQPSLTTGDDVRRRVDGLRLPSAFVVIHAKSNERERDWTAEGWSSLLLWLVEQGRAVVEVGMAPAAAPGDTPGVTQLCGKLSILETAEVIRRARLFVGVDSGPAHLANAVLTPGVIILGRYRSFQDHVPYSGHYASANGADLLRADGPPSCLPAEEVIAAVSGRLDAQAASQSGFA